MFSDDKNEISKQVTQYETKNWLLARRILFPINLVAHIIIGVFAAKKIFAINKEIS